MSAREGTDECRAIIIDLNWPDQVKVFGDNVKLQSKQWDLLVQLASRPGKLCPYDEIYKTLWPDTIVEPGQMHFQKSRLLKALAGARPEAKDWVTTIPKRGFVLNLKRSEILIRA